MKPAHSGNLGRVEQETQGTNDRRENESVTEQEIK